MQQCIKVLLFLILNKAQHVSGDTPPISRSLKLHKQPLDLRKQIQRLLVQSQAPDDGRCVARNMLSFI
jgi:hypothetical protein